MKLYQSAYIKIITVIPLTALRFSEWLNNPSLFTGSSGNWCSHWPLTYLQLSSTTAVGPPPLRGFCWDLLQPWTCFQGMATAVAGPNSGAVVEADLGPTAVLENSSSTWKPNSAHVKWRNNVISHRVLLGTQGLGPKMVHLAALGRLNNSHHS